MISAWCFWDFVSLNFDRNFVHVLVVGYIVSKLLLKRWISNLVSFDAFMNYSSSGKLKVQRLENQLIRYLCLYIYFFNLFAKLFALWHIHYFWVTSISCKPCLVVEDPRHHREINRASVYTLHVVYFRFMYKSNTLSDEPRKLKIEQNEAHFLRGWTHLLQTGK